MKTDYRIVVLLSGSGTTLQSIIDAKLPATLSAVISNKPNVQGLTRAKEANIPTHVLEHSAYSSREAFDQDLKKLIDNYQPDLVVLAGFMRILSDDFVHHYYGKLINIHPSLLPKYKGTHSHQRVMDDGEPLHGSSVHFVNTELDSGPILLQARLPVLPNDTVESLELRVKVKEHLIYPTAISWLAEGRIKLDNDQIYMDGKKMRGPVVMDYM
ncbi:MAG: phosphoribosylglycinamide formyltransferase-1 [Cycloclasticus sp.]|jgi:phosphoribosylglycinamide formyltransferase-1|tara:strand:+ start:314 stop:952 length:639 start_codon:yes stop_codon:yes gene_type:complete